MILSRVVLSSIIVVVLVFSFSVGRAAEQGSGGFVDVPNQAEGSEPHVHTFERPTSRRLSVSKVTWCSRRAYSCLGAHLGPFRFNVDVSIFWIRVPSPHAFNLS